MHRRVAVEAAGLEYNRQPFERVERRASDAIAESLRIRLGTEMAEDLGEQQHAATDKAQPLIEACTTRPDFIYESGGTLAAIYVDGLQHDYPENKRTIWR